MLQQKGNALNEIHLAEIHLPMAKPPCPHPAGLARNRPGQLCSSARFA